MYPWWTEETSFQYIKSLPTPHFWMMNIPGLYSVMKNVIYIVQKNI